MIQSAAVRLEPTTHAAASNTPRNAGVSPASSQPLPACERSMTKSHVLGRLKQQQLGLAGFPRFQERDLVRQAALLELAHEGGVAVGTERMAVAEAVAGQLLAEHDCNLRACGVQALRFEL